MVQQQQQRQRKQVLFWIVLIAILALVRAGRIASAAAAAAQQRTFKVINQSGEMVTVEWVNPSDGQRIPLGAPTAGESVDIDSFVNHTFVIRSSSSSSSAAALDANNQTTRTEEYFQVTDDEIQIIVVKDGLVLDQTVGIERVLEDQQEESEASSPHKATSHKTELDISSDCKARAEKSFRDGRLDPQVILDRLAECLTRAAAAVIVEKSDELALEASLRKEMSRLAENYTCADVTRQVSDPIDVKMWTHPRDGVTRKVHILHERPGSQIHMLHDFISQAECQAIQEAAAPTLHRGTVADGKGGSRMSENRKAWQAGIKVDWDLEEQGDPIAAVKRRLFDYANHATGYDMHVDGQEDLMSIQYFGNGLNDTKPDRYMPHCDGQCDGLPFKTGGRVATMVMYCDVPEVGGGTNFQNAGVFVKPTKGAAAFFSYLNKDTWTTEEAFTSHSGCPVLIGTKRIAVQWMRVGVDSENPWDAFDTNNILLKNYVS